MAPPPEARTQFAFWLRNDLAARFRAFCERHRLFQREAAEKAIAQYLDVAELVEADNNSPDVEPDVFESPRAGAPESAAVSSTFPAPDQGRGSDSRDGGK